MEELIIGLKAFVIGLVIVFFNTLQISLNANRAHISVIVITAMMTSFVTVILIEMMARQNGSALPYVLGSGIGAGISYLFRK